MIEDQLIYLLVERLKQLKSPGMSLEDADLGLNLLDNVLFHRLKKEQEPNYKQTKYETLLTRSYLKLDEEDYQAIGIEANIWFLELINDQTTEENIYQIISENIDRFPFLYATLEHPYCRYLLMMIYSNSNLSKRIPHFDFPHFDFIDKILEHYQSQGEKFSPKEKEDLVEEIITILEDVHSLDTMAK